MVAIDEPYFEFVYRLIRETERAKGSWTNGCERAFQEIIGGHFESEIYRGHQFDPMDSIGLSGGKSVFTKERNDATNTD